MPDLVIRPLVPGEEHLFAALPTTGAAGRALLGEEPAGYRPELMWVALREGTVVARAAWWAGPEDETPVALDWFDFTDFDAAVALLRTVPWRAEYSLHAPPGWRADPAAAREVQTRLDAAEAAGLELLVERYRYEWTPECGLPSRPGRLAFRPEPDDARILDVFREIHQDSLDAHARRATAERGLDVAAQEDLDLLRSLPSPREWWRLAYTSEGALAGLVVPARNSASPIVAYVAVLPAHRGRGYSYDLLVEATHDLVAEGAEKIVAATDRTNFPMARAFAKAGYAVTQHRIDLV
ncbi:GNAT family N-acetyltransferase [Amycolatopsis silviterrae]|uniref:GNAT family N-acetyltransferase n=1 Tax=Amycolatopsis silviterrae TaxID=1656914 RepID=A0ABW5HM65_9PSEU